MHLFGRFLKDGRNSGNPDVIVFSQDLSSEKKRIYYRKERKVTLLTVRGNKVKIKNIIRHIYGTGDRDVFAKSEKINVVEK